MVAEVTTEGRVRRPSLSQWAGLAGILYVVLYVVGAILSYGGQPDTSSPNEVLVSHYSDAGNRDSIVFGWILVLLGVFCFLWFVAGLRQALRRIDDDGFLTGLATIGGAVYAALALAAISVNAAIKTMSDDTFRNTVYPELIHAADDTAYVLHAAAGVGAGAMMVAASLAVLRARVLPPWVAWVGILLGIAALFSIFFLPQIGIAVWLIAAGAVVFFARDRRAA